MSTGNDELEIADEFEEALMFKVRYYMRAETGDETAKATQLFYNRSKALYYENLPRVNNRLEEVFQHWKSGGAGGSRRFTNTTGRTSSSGGYGSVSVG